MSVQTIAGKYGPLLGRILIAGVYIASGIGLAGDFGNVVALMSGKGVPAPAAVLSLTIAIWLFGGACVLLGWHLRAAAALLLVWTIPILTWIHGPWSADATAFQNELNHFLKGVAMLGGLAYLAAFGPGPISLARDAEARASP